ncbi:MAG: alkaline phosphatase D family protein [Alphaproteobacteria bacterium]|nr:alkaline phosphatase D family protein [Alphaproteobacteria bacterium]
MISRRRLLAGAAALAPFAILRGGRAAAREPFTLGVASGCPRPDRVVLWTRLAPEPLEGGGMPDAPVAVEWELAEDERFARIAARGTFTAVPEAGHTVHAEPAGLAPGRWYWYRFRTGGAISPVGRTRTAPAEGAATTSFRFAFASCQMYEHGYYAAYRHMAAQDHDLVVHLGDYIYEMSWGRRHVRKHLGAIPTELWEFRDRYALYKSDADLQAAHHAFPWLAVWDDHEVANDYAGDHSPRTSDPGQFLRIRAAAYRAFWEHMPLPMAAAPRGPDMRIYDRYRFGDLVDMMLLDDRQYRAAHACGTGPVGAGPATDCPERIAPGRTMLGAAQEAWLDGALRQARGRWTVVAQQTLMAELDRRAGPERAYWLDGWDGYPAARGRLLSAIAAHRPSNPVVIGGDVHAFWVADLKRDFADPASPTIASELVGSSITSQGPSENAIRTGLAENPHIRYARGDKRGYVAMTLDAKACRAELMGVDDAFDAASAVRPIAAFTIEDGVPGAKPA